MPPSTTPAKGIFGAKPFRRGQALEAGITAGQLRGPRYRRLFRDVYVAAEVADTLELRCDGLRLLLPDSAVFSHRTAAGLYQLPIHAGSDLHIRLPSGVAVPDIAGVRPHEGLRPDEVRTWRGRRLTSPARTWLDLVADAADAGGLGFVDVVAVGDAVLRRLAKPAALERALATATGQRGVVRARKALPLLRERVDSPMETRLRLIIVMSGLPCPQVNVDLVDETAWQARPDLSYPQYRIAIEYDGGTHQTDRRQWRDDVLRDDLYDQLGWSLLKFTAHDVLRSPRRIVTRVREKLAAAGASVPELFDLRPRDLAAIDHC